MLWNLESGFIFYMDGQFFEQQFVKIILSSLIAFYLCQKLKTIYMYVSFPSLYSIDLCVSNLLLISSAFIIIALY